MYSKYKSSEVEWVSNIPDTWKIINLGNLFSISGRVGWKNLRSDEYIDDPEYIFLSTPNLKNKEIDFLNVNYISKFRFDESPEIKLEIDDIILVKSGSTLGIVNIVRYLPKPTTINGSSVLLRKKQPDINPYYYYYFFSSYYFQNLMKITQSGVGVPSVNQSDISKFKIIKPPYTEQIQIVQYLDEKTDLLDKLISKKERKIELLKSHRTSLINEVITKGLNPNVKMKDSGIEWIGHIPEHWERKRIKTISSVISKGTTPSTIGKDITDEGEVRFLKSENIVDNSLSVYPQFFIDKETNEILKRSILLEGDILFVIAGASIGKTTILTKEFSPSNTNQAVSFIRLKPNENNKFVWYWLISSNIQEQMWVVSVQSAQPNLSMENLGNFHIPYPPISEQQQIVEYLNTRTYEIDELVLMEQKKIELLKEYRQSLISEVITGKIDVRTNLN